MRKVRIATADSAGLASGRKIRHQSAGRPRPSSRTRLLQLGRQGDEELAHDEGGQDAGSGQRGDQDQRPVGVDHPGSLEHLEQGHDRHLAGHQEADQHHQEEGVRAGEADPREGVPGEAGDQQGDQGDQDGDVHAVRVLPGEGLEAERLGVRGQRGVGSPQRRRGLEDLGQRLHRSGHHPDGRHHERDGQYAERRHQERPPEDGCRPTAHGTPTFGAAATAAESAA